MVSGAPALNSIQATAKSAPELGWIEVREISNSRLGVLFSPEQPIAFHPTIQSLTQELSTSDGPTLNVSSKMNESPDLNSYL